jgi:hypothetical protein
MRSLRWSNQDHFDWRNDLAESMVHSALTVDLATPIGVSAETRVAVELGEAGSHGLTQWCCRSGKELQLRWARSQLRWVSSNNRSERSRGRVFGEPRREVDDEDKTASFVAVAPPRRSTSSLGVNLMLKVSDGARAKYLLRARADGKFKLWPFIVFNKWRYIFFSLYTLCGAAYLLHRSQLLALWFFAGLCVGMLITDFSWFVGRNKGRHFAFKTTNWEEITVLGKDK